jgi:hypothetical protein
MLRNPVLALAATALLGVSATAQFCSDNTYPLRLVTAAGTELPRFFDPVVNQNTYQAQTEAVYLAFDSNLPTGTYYVHVTDNPIDGFDEVLSQNDPMDRFVFVTNTNGVITLSLPFSANPNPVFGLGLNGQGQSLLLSPFAAPTFSQCRFKAWYGNNWDLSNGPSNPYLLAGGLHPLTNQCSVRSYEGFRIGDGNGSDVSGIVFNDLDHDGIRDAGENGLPGWEVRLVTPTTSVSAFTGANGGYLFENVIAGSYSVELQLQNGFVVTTSSSHSIEVCSCANVAVADFGVATMILPSAGHTIGYWGNKHGLALVQQYNILAMLPSLHIVNQAGQYVAPGNTTQFKNWLQNANSVNMAYMLSAQLVAMHCSITVGNVHPDSVIDDPELGIVTIGSVVQQAIVSLGLHPLTLPGRPFRAGQTALKNALDRANNNQNWM